MVRHPHTGQIRITMTPYAIRQSNRIIYHVLGRGKSDIIFKLASKVEDSKKYPASHIPGEWYLDSDAASKLS
jgi:6-phosphogluconolactonase/glucosamine-6-phosphate isomerase/deaminase